MSVLTMILLLLLVLGFIVMFWPGNRILFDVAIFIILIVLLTGIK